MRYYKIVITSPQGKVTNTFTSYVNNVTDPGALDIELDISVASYHEAIPNKSFVRVYGIPLNLIAQAKNFNGSTIQVFGGMQKGLPLANPAQSGLLVTGSVLQAFGNWIGTSQTLDFILGGPIGSNSSPINITFNWLKGQAIGDAIRAALNPAFKGYTINIAVKSGMTATEDHHAYYASLTQFTQDINEISKVAFGNGGPYSGINIVLQEKNINVYDGTTPKQPKQIAFTDLLGQPTWLAPGLMQIFCVMRADLQLGDYIQLPKTPITTTAQSISQERNNSTFQGIFPIGGMRHVGRFRQPDGLSWLTVIDGRGDGSAPTSSGGSTST